MDKLALIQSQVLAKKRVIKQNLKDWEKQYCLDHDCRMPTLNEIKSSELASKPFKQLKYSAALLKGWNIQF